MSHTTKRGMPILKDATDVKFEDYKYLVNYSVPFSFIKSVRERGADWNEAMLMIDMLLESYEMTYYPHAKDLRLVYMPYLFMKPSEGTQIRNTITNEIYTIADVLTNPKTKLWEGLIRLAKTNTPPSRNAVHKLTFLDQDKRVRFTHEYPEHLSTQGALEVDNKQIDSGPIRPTITYSLKKKEPGSFGKEPFSPQKNYKHRHREYIKDPNNVGHTIEVRGVLRDCLGEFICWTTDNFSADLLTDWFEKFMSLYTVVLKRAGVVDILFWERQGDAAVTKWRQDLISRTLQYYFRIEDIEIIIRKDLLDLDIEVNVSRRSLTSLKQDYIAEQLVSQPGQLTLNQYSALFKDSNGNYLFGTTTYNE